MDENPRVQEKINKMYEETTFSHTFKENPIGCVFIGIGMIYVIFMIVCSGILGLLF